MILGILSSISYGFYNFFSNLSGNQLNPYLSLLIFTLTAFLLSLVIYATNATGPVVVSKERMYPILGGLSFGFAQLLYLRMFSKGAELSTALPIIDGLSIIVACGLGVWFLGEGITTTKVVGIIGIIVSAFILGK